MPDKKPEVELNMFPDAGKPEEPAEEERLYPNSPELYEPGPVDRVRGRQREQAAIPIEDRDYPNSPEMYAPPPPAAEPKPAAETPPAKGAEEDPETLTTEDRIKAAGFKDLTELLEAAKSEEAAAEEAGEGGEE